MSQTVTDVARTLVERLAEYATAAQKLIDIEMRSKKHIERAGRALTDITQMELRIGEALVALNQALSTAGAGQQEQAAGVAAAAERIEKRARDFDALMQRYAKLGATAAALSATVNAPDQDIAAVDVQVTALLDEAEAIYKDAREQDFIDVAQDSDSLRQNLTAIRNKLRKLLA